MSNEDLSGESHDIKSNGEMWWYEVGVGMKILVNRNSVDDSSTIIGIIPWRTIRNALKRKDKK